ncbi:hypothetical protein OUZ56_021522 [Daphnia magna]|uniref:Uncharacterized protein n=1 Tax=Daphnia magna TaxID=35525 RepID=A0ABQ9ZHL9_9CRUS|nr:hypothetical protein OUZ56_021522 [Daphnia magna]
MLRLRFREESCSQPWHRRDSCYSRCCCYGWRVLPIGDCSQAEKPFSCGTIQMHPKIFRFFVGPPSVVLIGVRYFSYGAGARWAIANGGRGEGTLLLENSLLDSSLLEVSTGEYSDESLEPLQHWELEPKSSLVSSSEGLDSAKISRKSSPTAGIQRLFYLLHSQRIRLYWQSYCLEKVGTSTLVLSQLLPHRCSPTPLPIALLFQYPVFSAELATVGSYTPPGYLHLRLSTGLKDLAPRLKAEGPVADEV